MPPATGSLVNHITSASIVNENLLLQTLASIFPGDQIHQKVKSDLNVKYPRGTLLEFDFWIPKYQLCFEFQDAYHYISIWYCQKTKDFIAYKDDVKKKLANMKEMSLIEIPCWWSGSSEDLIASICFQRPDLQNRITTENEPISLAPPAEFFNIQMVPDVGEMMLASISPHSLSSTFNNNKWWIGEKYDGVRFCWHSSYSRNGNELPLTSEFTRRLPAIFIDGELWFGRGQFAKVYDLLQGNDCYWPSLRLISFDVPASSFQQHLYESRYRYLDSYCDPDHPFNILALRMLCNRNTLHWFLQYTIDGGGEGVILQKCGSIYEQGRSQELYKVKVALGDQEGIVLGIGATQSVSLKLPNNARVTVPPFNVLISTPREGDIVSFYLEPESSSPKIYRIRTDMSWDDVVYNFYRESQHAKKFGNTRGVKQYGNNWTQTTLRKFLENFVRSKNLDPLQPKTWYTAYRLLNNSHNARRILDKIKRSYFQTIEELFPVQFDAKAVIQFHHWNKLEHRRKFFEEYATKNKFDPLIPENWYTESKTKILEIKGAKRVIWYHKYSVAQALLDLFPNIGFDRLKFFPPQNKWNSVAKRRSFFIEYARTHGFDPLNPENWYSQPTIDTHGAQMLLFHYSNSVSKALVDLFPDIGLDRSKFSLQVAPYNVGVHKNFFEKYAKERGFDPLVPDNWYIQPKETITAVKGAQRVLIYYGHSVPEALTKAFPNIGLDKSKFPRAGTWEKVSNRRKFFEDFAASNGFDPLTSENWYLQSKDKIRAFPGAHNVLFYYNYSISKSLGDLFPEVGIEKSKFLHKSFWNNSENRKQFFEDYARVNKFDPRNPENWYLQSSKQIFSFKNARSVLFYHSKNVVHALTELFPDIGLERSKFSIFFLSSLPPVTLPSPSSHCHHPPILPSPSHLPPISLPSPSHLPSPPFPSPSPLPSPLPLSLLLPPFFSPLLSILFFDTEKISVSFF